MPPVNDNVANAIALTVAGTVTGDNTGAGTESADELAWYGSNVPTVWYYYTNGGASTIVLGFSNLIGDAGFVNGADLDIWSFPSGLPTNFDDLHANGNWETFIGQSPFASGGQLTTTISVAPGDSVLIASDNWNFNTTDFGVFSFDWETVVAGANVDFATARALTGALSGHVHQSLANLTPTDYYWYKIIPPDNPNGGTLTLKNSLSIFNNVYAAWMSTALDSISAATGFAINNPTGQTFIVYGPSLYFRIQGDFAEIVDFDWEWTPFAAAATPINAAPGTEVRSPSAPVTTYPGGAVAVRVTDFVAGGSIGSDSGAPNGDYVSDTQNITPTYANYFDSANAVSMADTITIDCNDVGLEAGIEYNVYFLCKAEGTVPAFGRNFQTFTSNFAAQIWLKNDTNGFWGSTWCANNRETWNYQLSSRNVQFKALVTDVLHIRAFGIGGTGQTVKIAQIVFLPGARFNDSSYPSGDLESLEDATSWFFGDNMPADDNEPDGLGLYTVDLGRIIQGTEMALIDYQDGSGVEFDQENIYPFNEEFQTYWEAPTHMYYKRGIFYHPQATHHNEDFGANFGPVLGPSPEIHDEMPRSTYGRVWNNFISSVDGGNTPTTWDLGHVYDGGLQAAAFFGNTGGVFSAGVGGENTQVIGIMGTLGTNFKDPVSSGQVPISATGESPPTFQHMHNWIIESAFSFDYPIDGFNAAGGDVGEIGVYSAAQMTFTGGSNITSGISLVINMTPAGALNYRVAQRNGSTSEHVIASGSFDTSYTLNRKIVLKMRKREYNIDIKIWYEDAGEPGSWTQSFHYDLFEVHGFSNLYIAYPYYPNTATYQTQWSTIMSRAYEDFFYFQSQCNRQQTVPTNNGGQHHQIIFSWYYYKINYDPDGATNKNVHTNLIDELTSTTVCSSTAPSTRDCIFYGGLRRWSVVDGSFGSGFSGFKSYDWLDSGAGNLVGAASGDYMWRFPRSALAAVTYVLASLYNKVILR